MELLDQLEARITDLLTRIDELARENSRLKENVREELENAHQKNTLLSLELEQEKQRNNAALERIEAILERLKERSGNE